MSVYYNPEGFGLKVVAEIDASRDDYGFDMVVVWKAKNGWTYWAHDSGCSCPSPFEDYHNVDQLERLNRKTWDDFERTVKSLNASLQDEQHFFRRVEKEMRRI